MANLLARNWWIVGLRGLAAIILGIIAVAIPHIALLAVIYVLSAYALINGLITIFIAVVGRAHVNHWVWLLAEGIAGVLIGIIFLRWPSLTLLVVVAFIAAWALINGAGEIFQGIQLRKVLTNEWLLILSGVASVLFALILLFFPGSSIITLMIVFGVYAIIFGALLLGVAWQLRSLPNASKAA